MHYLATSSFKKISKIGLGTWQFGSAEWGYGHAYAARDAAAIVARAVELGVTLFDTAEIYAAGHSERILGAALGDQRDAVFLSTKVFPLVPSAAVVRQRAAASARRLGVQVLDLYQSHWPNPAVSDVPLMRGMRSLLESGTITDVGVSNYPLARWRAAERALGRPVLVNEVQYSLIDRAPELELLPYAAGCDRVIIAFSPLAHGLLSGRFHDGTRPANKLRAGSGLFAPAGLEATRPLIAALQQVARVHDATPAQIALAWVIRHPAVAAIPGASSVAQLEHNVAAADIDLSEDEYQELSAASAPFKPAAVEAPTLRHQLALFRHSLRGARKIAKTIAHDHKPAATVPAPGTRHRTARTR